MIKFLLLSTFLFVSLVYGEEKYSHSIKKETGFSEEKTSLIAELWGVSEKEVLRYQEIINGPLGKWNPNVDPIMALGIYAKNEADRRYYAELYALQEFKLTEMTQLFSREYNKTFKRLFHDAKIIDPKLLAKGYENQDARDILGRYGSETVLKKGDRLLYFSDIHCRVCKDHIKKFESIIREHKNHFVDITVDIYIVNAKKEENVRQWALKNRVNTDLVKNSLITLNIDNGLQNQLNLASKQESSLYLLRDNKTFVVNPAQIGL